MKKLFAIAIASVLLSCSVNEKDCTCESNFEWVKKTFEENESSTSQETKHYKWKTDSLLRPYLKELNKTTLYLRIPSFELDRKQAINSLFESPCKEFILTYSLARSLYMPDMLIDDIGIQPDFYLDTSIPQNKLVEFVNDLLNQ